MNGLLQSCDAQAEGACLTRTLDWNCLCKPLDAIDIISNSGGCRRRYCLPEASLEMKLSFLSVLRVLGYFSLLSSNFSHGVHGLRQCPRFQHSYECQGCSSKILPGHLLPPSHLGSPAPSVACQHSRQGLCSHRLACSVSLTGSARCVCCQVVPEQYVHRIAGMFVNL